jgi:uncharacterized protein (DUF1810 family)
MNDACKLQRFIDAQQQVFERAYRELRQGRKQSHWMWFIFPQIKGRAAVGWLFLPDESP